jgi:hypothetical protein
MTEQRLTEQLRLVFTTAEDVQSSAAGGDAESVVAKREPERPAVTSSLMAARHHTTPRSRTADVHVAVVRIPNEAVPTTFELAIERV